MIETTESAALRSLSWSFQQIDNCRAGSHSNDLVADKHADAKADLLSQLESVLRDANKLVAKLDEYDNVCSEYISAKRFIRIAREQ